MCRAHLEPVAWHDMPVPTVNERPRQNGAEFVLCRYGTHADIGKVRPP